jgi:hypothetical protein
MCWSLQEQYDRLGTRKSFVRYHGQETSTFDLLTRWVSLFNFSPKSTAVQIVASFLTLGNHQVKTLGTGKLLIRYNLDRR